MSEVLGIFLQSGLPGAALVVLGFVIYHLWKSNNQDRVQHSLELAKRDKDVRDVEALRIADAKEMYVQRIADANAIHQQMLEVVKQCTTVMETTSSSLDGHRDATIEHREAQKEAAEELRKLSLLLTNLSEEIRTRIRDTARRS